MMRSLIAAAAAAVAVSQGQWQIIAKNIGTIATGISFNSLSEGFVPLDENGVGAEVLISQDGGVTWPITSSVPFALLYLDVASYGPYVATVGALSTIFSWDHGRTFNSSLGGAGAVQCVRTINPSNPVGFGSAGVYGLFNEVNGVATSTDGGLSWTTFDIGLGTNETDPEARYAAFPSANTWFVAAGEFPSNAFKDIPAGFEYVRRVTKRLSVVRNRETGEHKLHRHMGAANGRSLQTSTSTTSTSTTSDDPSGGGQYNAALVKTTDGGKTFSLVNYINANGTVVPFFDRFDFYLNGIECTSETNCCVVGESEGATPIPGTHIWCTQDGMTFNQTFYNNDPASDLIDISAVGPGELWAVGSELSDFGPAYATFWHSTDGGQSWTLDSKISGEEAMDVDCVPSLKRCWATTVDILQTSSVSSNNAANATRTA